jgi:heavy metal efflux system protein
VPDRKSIRLGLVGLKSALAVKVYGPDLNVLQSDALEIKKRLSRVPDSRN